MRFKFLRTRTQAYRQTFSGPFGERVLADLKHFCYVDRPTLDPANPDPILTAHKEGRRETWLRINTFLQLPDDVLNRLSEE